MGLGLGGAISPAAPTTQHQSHGPDPGTGTAATRHLSTMERIAAQLIRT